MAVAEQVRNVLSGEYRDLIVEDMDDGSTIVRDASAEASAAEDTGRFPVSDTLCRCADLLADSGFVIALVRDEDGVYLNAH
jgi:hypothetical protein